MLKISGILLLVLIIFKSLMSGSVLGTGSIDLTFSPAPSVNPTTNSEFQIAVQINTSDHLINALQFKLKLPSTTGTNCLVPQQASVKERVNFTLAPDTFSLFLPPLPIGAYNRQLGYSEYNLIFNMGNQTDSVFESGSPATFLTMGFLASPGPKNCTITLEDIRVTGPNNFSQTIGTKTVSINVTPPVLTSTPTLTPSPTPATAMTGRIVDVVSGTETSLLSLVNQVSVHAYSGSGSCSGDALSTWNRPRGNPPNNFSLTFSSAQAPSGYCLLINQNNSLVGYNGPFKDSQGTRFTVGAVNNIITNNDCSSSQCTIYYHRFCDGNDDGQLDNVNDLRAWVDLFLGSTSDYHSDCNNDDQIDLRDYNLLRQRT